MDGIYMERIHGVPTEPGEYIWYPGMRKANGSTFSPVIQCFEMYEGKLCWDTHPVSEAHWPGVFYRIEPGRCRDLEAEVEALRARIEELENGTDYVGRDKMTDYSELSGF